MIKHDLIVLAARMGATSRQRQQMRAADAALKPQKSADNFIDK